MPTPSPRSSTSSIKSIGGTALAIVVGLVLWYAQSKGMIGSSSTSSTSSTPPPDDSTTRPSPSPALKTTSPASVDGKRELATTESASIRIGAWNVEWLGKPEDRSGAGQGVAQNPADLAECIAQSKVSVLGLEEIVTQLPGRPVRSRELEQVLDALKTKTGHVWEYVLNPGRSQGDQLTGVAWDTTVVQRVSEDDRPLDASEPPWIISIPRARSAQGSSLFNRPPHAIKFSAGKGKTDFVVIVVHLKADYQGDFAAHRGEEAAALVAALPEVRSHFHDTDIIIIGDTNCTSPHEPAIDVFEKAGFTDVGGGKSSTHWRGGSMDRALVPANQREFGKSTFTVMSDPLLQRLRIDAREYKRRFSDHFLVFTALDVMPDDD